MPQVIEFEGQRHEFPDDFTDQDISFALASLHPPESRGFLGSFWDTLKQGPGNLEAFGNSLLHPASTLHGLLEQNSELGKRTVDEFRSGNYGESARAGINYLLNMIPGLGTSSQEAGDKLAQGDISGGLGATAGVGVNTALMLKTPAIVRGAAKTVHAVTHPESFTRVRPGPAIARALSPPANDPDFSVRLPQTLGNIKRANGGISPASDTELITAANRGIASHQDALSRWNERAEAGRVRISGQPIVDATRAAFPQPILPSDAPRIQAILSQVEADFGGGREFSPTQFRNLIKRTNQELDAFQARKEGSQYAAEASGRPEGIVKAQLDTMRDLYARALDPEGNGAGPRLIQRETGDMISLRDAAKQRVNAILKEQPISRAETARKAITASVTLPFRAFLNTDPAMRIPEAFHGVSNPLIRRAFDSVPEPRQVPLPGTPLYPQVPRQLGPGPTITPPPADPSFVRGVPPAPHQTVNLQRPALPAPTTPYGVSGVTVPPDIAQPRGQVPPGRLLPPPSPGTPPVNVLPPGPAGTPRPAPPMGTSAILDQPGLPLGLPAPPPPPVRQIIIPPEPGRSYSPETFRPENVPPPSQTIGESTARNLGRAIWEAIRPKGTTPDVSNASTP